MADKIDRLIAELKTCDTHPQQYNLLKEFSLKCWAAGMAANPNADKVTKDRRFIPALLNLMKRKPE